MPQNYMERWIKRKEYVKTHREEILAARKKFYAKNPERFSEWHRDYRERHKEELRVKKAKYAKEHPEVYRAIGNRYTHSEKYYKKYAEFKESDKYEQKKAYRRQWGKEHREHLREYAKSPKMQEARRKYIEANRDKKSEWNRQHYQRHKEEIKANVRKRYWEKKNESNGIIANQNSEPDAGTEA